MKVFYFKVFLRESLIICFLQVISNTTSDFLDFWKCLLSFAKHLFFFSKTLFKIKVLSKITNKLTLNITKMVIMQMGHGWDEMVIK